MSLCSYGTPYLGKQLCSVDFLSIVSFFVQLLFVLFVCMLLQTQVQGKPYKSQEEEEQRFTEPDINESNQAIQNETLVVRGKREVIYNFTSFCNAANYAVSYGPPTSTSSNGCVERWYYCRGYAEPVCRKRSLQCYNIAQFGFPKCTATVVTKIIENRKIKMTACECAQ